MCVLSSGPAYAAAPGATEQRPPLVPKEEYPFFDQVIDEMFLTSETKLVLIERLTVTRLHPDQEKKLSIEIFREDAYFEGQLPSDLVGEFISKNQTPSRLEARLQFGVRYRFVSGGEAEGPEVSLAPIPVSSSQGIRIQEAPFEAPPSILDRLAFSRVAFTLKNDQALVYVENNRPDASGAGFLVWLRQTGKDWDILDTEVVWTAQSRAPGAR